MKAQHTPGPWTVFTNPDGTKIVGIGDRNAEGVTDCGFGIWRGGSEEALANAHLISAAPDLLIQLKGMLGFAEFVIAAVDIDTDQTKVVLRANGESVAEVPISTLLTHTKAAIAKAEARA